MNPLLHKVSTTRFVCEPFHSDFMGQLTLNVLGNHLLNCAGEHATERGFGMARLNEEDHTWVLSRMAIEFEELPKQYESFEIDTWVESVYRLFTDRNFAIRNQEGHTIGYARTVWAMIGVQSRKPIDLLSMHEGHLSDYVYPEKPCPIEKPGRIKVSAQMPSEHFTARYSDIDINGHVNSIRYIEHVMDLFSLDYLREHPLRRFEIAYVTESYFGDTLDIYIDSKSNEHQVEIKKGNATICRCKLFFS
ncbi:MAG: acyl-[Bacteroidales bacterium]|nr:acyl-[acyl-carrier-protein] thioesterase [Bacteroidales bacterium]